MTTGAGTKDRYQPQSGQQSAISCEAFHGSSTNPLEEADRFPSKRPALTAIRHADRPTVRLPKFPDRVTVVLPSNADTMIFPRDVGFPFRIPRPRSLSGRNRQSATWKPRNHASDLWDSERSPLDCGGSTPLWHFRFSGLCHSYGNQKMRPSVSRFGGVGRPAPNKDPCKRAAPKISQRRRAAALQRSSEP